MWKCDECGLSFREPVIEEYDERMPDGFKEHWVVLHCPCPQCNSIYVSEVVDGAFDPE